MIYGGGPSLNQRDVDYAKSLGWKRIACNDAFRLDLECDVLCFADARWYGWNISVLPTHKGSHRITWAAIPPTGKDLVIRKLGHRRSPPPISFDPATIVANNTGQGAINIAFLFGVRRIVLLGFDMHIINRRHNWHTYHKKTTQPERYREVFIPGLVAAARILNQQGVETINATVGSSLTCFPHVNLRNIPKAI